MEKKKLGEIIIASLTIVVLSIVITWIFGQKNINANDYVSFGSAVVFNLVVFTSPLILKAQMKKQEDLFEKIFFWSGRIFLMAFVGTIIIHLIPLKLVVKIELITKSRFTTIMIIGFLYEYIAFKILSKITPRFLATITGT